jgi:hypothetical protein
MVLGARSLVSTVGHQQDNGGWNITRLEDRRLAASRSSLVLIGLLAIVLLASCSSTPIRSEATIKVNWPRSGPGGCGTSVPNSIPPNDFFIGVKAIAKPGVSDQEVLWSIPTTSIALWCVRVGFVDRFTTPLSVSLSSSLKHRKPT